MMETPFNSTFENALRILLLLNNLDMPISEEKVSALDFMTQYGHVFYLANYNLNGDNPYKFSEYLSKRQFTTEALKNLVMLGLVQPLDLSAGMQYSITPQGEEFCDSLDSIYAREYDEISQSVIRKTSEMEDKEIIAIIESAADGSTGE